eukprot:TRINITY_DN1741_c0_g1_i1.p2 TRINITY_DN1741_c0_g1~~TRINITY_DN1741_c0_g1_i1.p2  ORF type:complete len:217 (+),score=30.71 TRINITY_DN1741_c0_g1_i1:27-653(+)
MRHCQTDTLPQEDPQEAPQKKSPVPVTFDDETDELSAEETVGSCFDVLSPKGSNPLVRDSECPESDGLGFKPATIPHQPAKKTALPLVTEAPEPSQPAQKVQGKRSGRRRATVSTDWWQQLGNGDGAQAVLVLHSQWSDDDDEDFPMPKVHIPVRSRGTVLAGPRRSAGRLGGRSEDPANSSGAPRLPGDGCSPTKPHGALRGRPRHP